MIPTRAILCNWSFAKKYRCIASVSCGLSSSKLCGCFFFHCSEGREHVHHIGLVANFTAPNGCLPSECTTSSLGVNNISTSSSNETTTYICTGCRHRWRWLDGSDLSRDYHRWASDQPSLYSTTSAHCVVLHEDFWTTANCDDLRGYYICKRSLQGMFHVTLA